MTSTKAPLRCAVLGGGNGIPSALQGLADLAGRGLPLAITAIVATADDGGSSGRIRRDHGGLPPGDLRRCLLALSQAADGPFARLFRHRYSGEGDLAGHSLGNLLLTALAEQHGSYVAAVAAAGRMLQARGRVLPVTEEAPRLEGETITGDRLSGESRIGSAPAAIRRLWCEPQGVRPADGVLQALHEADLVVIGPGSHFTSVLAVLLVDGVADAVRASHAVRILVGNLMTQPGETLGMSMADHLEALDRHVGAGLVDTVLLNSTPISEARLRPYAEQSVELVTREGLAGRRERFIEAPVVNDDGKIRHDPARLAEALIGIVLGRGEHRGRVASARPPDTWAI
ncbi:MAG TPA: gluconeogenesis factor YvcK family protein [Candidatus Polarisedimenticolaceae bacterium]|nr:gluconeogenesis factor YvcK family protein [Candidatus Polarisedimenticolaceae bacterium]